MLNILRRWRLGAPFVLIVALIGARLAEVPALSDALYLLWRIGRRWVRTRGTRVDWRRVVQGEVASLVLTVAGLLLFFAAGALWHRPMLSLAGVTAGESVVD